MTAVAITILVKNPNAKQQGQIYYHDIGDYLSRDQKLKTINHLPVLMAFPKPNNGRHLNPTNTTIG